MRGRRYHRMSYGGSASLFRRTAYGPAARRVDERNQPLVDHRGHRFPRTQLHVAPARADRNMRRQEARPVLRLWTTIHGPGPRVAALTRCSDPLLGIYDFERFTPMRQRRATAANATPTSGRLAGSGVGHAGWPGWPHEITVPAPPPMMKLRPIPSKASVVSPPKSPVKWLWQGPAEMSEFDKPGNAACPAGVNVAPFEVQPLTSTSPGNSADNHP